MEKAETINTKKYLWVAIVTATIFVSWVQLPRILNPKAVDEDFRNMYWVHRYQEPDLYPTVKFQDYGVLDVQIGSWTYILEASSPGYSLFFQIASYVISPLLLSKLLAYPLMLFSVFYLFRITERLSDSGTALALSLAFVILSLASHSEISVVSGLHRSFAFPFTLALIYYLMTHRYKLALFILLLNGIIYIPSFPVAMMTYAFCQISVREAGRWKLTIQWKQIAGLLLIAVMVVLTISPMIVTQLSRAQDGIEATAAGEQNVVNDPERQAGGRGRLFVVFPFIGRGGLTSSAQDGLHLMIMSFFALVILAIRRSRVSKLPPALVKLLYASLAGYLLAWSAILLTSSFLFYLPSRHSRIGLFLVLLFFVGLNAQETFRLGVGWIMRNRQRLVWYLIPLAVIVVAFAFLLPDSEDSAQVDFRGPVPSAILIGLTLLLMVLMILVRRSREKNDLLHNENVAALPGRSTWIVLGSFLLIASLFYIKFMDTDYYVPSEDAVELFEFIETLPKDAIIAGSPCVLDSVPFYGRRAVLFSCERYLPKPNMIMDDLRAYYAMEGRELYEFCHQYGVSHLIVDEETLAPKFVTEGNFFFEPYDTFLSSELEGRTDFALNYVLEEQKLFQVDSVYVVPCERFLIDLTASG